MSPNRLRAWPWVSAPIPEPAAPPPGTRQPQLFLTGFFFLFIFSSRDLLWLGFSESQSSSRGRELGLGCKTPAKHTRGCLGEAWHRCLSSSFSSHFPFSMLAFWSRSRTFEKLRTIKEEKKSSKTQGGEDKAGIYCAEINQCKLRISHLLKPITVKRSNPLANSSFVSSRVTYKQMKPNRNDELNRNAWL